MAPAGLLPAGGRAPAGLWLVPRGRRLVTETSDETVETSDRVGADGVDFLLDRDRILRDVARELGELRPDHAAEARHYANGQDDG